MSTFRDLLCAKLNTTFDGQKFCDMLKKCDCYLSGSVILELLCDTKVPWQSDDIDIFFDDPRSQVTNPTPFEKYLTDQGFQITADTYDAYVFTWGIVYVRTYEKNDLKVQFIRSARDWTPKTRVNCFDLSVCRNLFDGENVYVSEKEDLTKCIFTVHPECLKDDKTLNRIKKYQERGFIYLTNS
jgi:hypothetical protein